MKRARLAGAAALFATLLTAAAGFWPEGLLNAEFARQRWLADAHEHTAVVAGQRWHYVQSGTGPLIVLVHGFTGSKENWLPLMRELRTRYRIIAPDLPGWGESGRQRNANYGPHAQAERLAAFLASLDAKPIFLVGHSMGGQIIGDLVAHHPAIVERIALMSSAGVHFRSNDFGRAVLAGRNPFEVRDRASLHRYLGIVFTDPPWVPWPVDWAMARQRADQVAFEQSVLDRIGRGPEAFALEAELPNIATPTLLLWCRDDRVIDISAVAIFQKGLAHDTAVMLDGCGHMPMMVQPAAVADAIVRFLNKPLKN